MVKLSAPAPVSIAGTVGPPATQVVVSAVPMEVVVHAARAGAANETSIIPDARPDTKPARLKIRSAGCDDRGPGRRAKGTFCGTGNSFVRKTGHCLSSYCDAVFGASVGQNLPKLTGKRRKLTENYRFWSFSKRSFFKNHFGGRDLKMVAAVSCRRVREGHLGLMPPFGTVRIILTPAFAMPSCSHNVLSLVSVTES